MSFMSKDSNKLKSKSNSVLISLPNDSPEQSPIKFKDVVYENYPWLWDWRTLITNKGLLTYLQRRLQENISSCVMIYTTKENIHYRRLHYLLTEVVQCPKTRAQYRIVPSVCMVIKELNLFLPVLLASQGCLNPICSSFNHVIHTYLVDLVVHIKALAEPNNFVSNQLEHLCVLLSSCYVLQLALKQYKFILEGKDTARPNSLIASIDRRLQVEIASLKLTILTWYRKTVTCSILHDSESHNWHKNKPFLEGENISYSLRMWNLSVKSMMFHFKTGLPSLVALDISFIVFCDALQLLVTRYANAQPSEVGTTQIRVELTFILCCVMEYLTFFCSSYEDLLGLENLLQLEPPDCNQIHSHASSLLIILAVKTSPLSSLYNTFKHGFPTIPSESQPFKRITPWLPWINPSLLSQTKDGSPMSSISAWLAVKSCISGPICNPLLLIQTLTMHTCTISILLATETSRLPIEENDNKITLLKAILSVALHCYHQPNGFTNILLPVIQNCNGWDCFDGHSAITNNCSSDLWWYQSLKTFLQPTVDGILNSVISVIINCSTVFGSPHLAQWKTMYLNLRRIVRCCCKNSSTVERNVIMSVFSLDLLHSIANSVALLPLPIQVCLFELQNQLSRSKSPARPVGGCVAMQIITDLIYNSLKNGTAMIQILGISVSGPMAALCSEIADYFLCLVTPKICFEAYEIPPLCREKAQGFLLQINGFFRHCKPKKVSEETIEDEHYLPLVYASLEQSEKGLADLHYLHDVLRINSKWIQKSLGVPCVLSTELMVNSLSPPSPIPVEPDQPQPMPSKADDSLSLWPGEANGANAHPLVDVQIQTTITDDTFMLNVNNERCDLFNPLREVCRIGDDCYTYKQLEDFRFFWDALLSHLPLLGLSEEGFKTLLSHRWDIRNDSDLTEEDAKCVQGLCSLYNTQNLMKH